MPNYFGRGGTCCLCGDHYEGFGHNPEPIVDYGKGRCCGTCNDTQVIPAHIARVVGKHPSNGRE